MEAENNLPAKTDDELSIDELLALHQVMPGQLAKLKKEDRKKFDALVRDKMVTLTDVERDEFIKKLEYVTPDEIKNKLWEDNHDRLSRAYYTYVSAFRRPPTNSELASETQLSRNTVMKHMKEFIFQPAFHDQIDQLRIISPKVVVALADQALNGDVRAIKLFLDLMNNVYKQPEKTDLIRQQYKYMMINDAVIDEEKIKNLSPEDRSAIETILKKAFPRPANGPSEAWDLAFKLAGVTSISEVKI